MFFHEDWFSIYWKLVNRVSYIVSPLMILCDLQNENQVEINSHSILVPSWHWVGHAFCFFTIRGTKSLRVENFWYNVEKHQRHEEIHKDLVSTRVKKNLYYIFFWRMIWKKLEDIEKAQLFFSRQQETLKNKNHVYHKC